MDLNHVVPSEANTVLVHSEIAICSHGPLDSFLLSCSECLYSCSCNACSFPNILLNKDVGGLLGGKCAS